MFCLRSWVPILFFLYRTNASPLFLILFISATYFLNRPCVYCSLLLFILVVALFDFHSPWFAQPLPCEGADICAVNNGTIAETAAVFVEAATNTAQAVLKNAVEGVKERMCAGEEGSGAGGFEWVKGLMGKKEWRVPCLDVLVRI